MGDPNTMLARLLAELKRRKVVQVTIAYGAFAWLLLQFGAIVFETFDSPAWSMRVLFVVLLLGLPTTVILAWVFEIGPGGIDRTPALEAERSPTGVVQREPSTLIKALALVFLTAVVGLLWSWLPSLQQGPEAESPTLAVLPFTDPTGDASMALLVEGLSDDLFNTVARIERVRIAARRSSRTLRDSDKSVQEIGQMLNAMLLLEGEIRPTPGRVKVTTWLTDTTTGLEVWSRTFEQPQARLDLIREDLTRQLAKQLGLSVAAEIFESQHAINRQHPDVYPMYLEALGYLKLPMTEHSLGSARERFEQVLAIAPDYVAARAGLCRTHLAFYVFYLDSQYFEDAQAYCREALDGQEQNVDLLLALGDLYRTQGDNVRAREFYERGIALSASNVEIQAGLAVINRTEGNMQAAERILLQALATDPAYKRLLSELGLLYIYMGRWDDSIRAYTRETELNPNDYGSFTNLGSAYFYAGRFAEAAVAYERSLEIEPNRTALSNTATMYFYTGDFHRAAELYAQAIELAEKDFRVWVNLADALRQIPGAEAEAEDNYRQAYALIEENLAINSEEPETLALAAWCAVNLDDAQTAELRITEAIVLAGDNPVILYYAAQVHEALGKVGIAASFVSRALAQGFPRNVMVATPGLAEMIAGE